jgi:putative SOS response-associated peptidase YedK
MTAESTESCLFHAANRYYEWLKKGPQRIPHFTRHKDRRLMLFAGLYDSATLDGALRFCCICALPRGRLMRGWRCCAGQSEPLWTFTIVTTAASSDYAWLHDRQPVILTSQDALDRWLDTSTQNWDPKLSRLLDPYTDSDFPLEWCAGQSPIGRH